jgi:tartrate-resistant acid phosphatase type 5
VKDLKPLLEKYKAALYLNGHDHNLQHIKEDDKDVSYFVVGAAHLSDDSRAHKDDVPAGSLKYFWPEKSSG